MSEPLTVNKALEELPTLDGNDVQITGMLHFEFEDVALYHSPKQERKDGYASSVWLDFGTSSFGFNQVACSRLNGKLVTVQGTVRGPDVKFGCGHMGLWPAVVQVRTITRAEGQVWQTDTV